MTGGRCAAAVARAPGIAAGSIVTSASVLSSVGPSDGGINDDITAPGKASRRDSSPPTSRSGVTGATSPSTAPVGATVAASDNGSAARSSSERASIAAAARAMARAVVPTGIACDGGMTSAWLVVAAADANPAIGADDAFHRDH